MDTAHVIDFRYSPSTTWTNIGLPDDFYKSLVSEKGALLYGYEQAAVQGWHFNRVYEFGIQAAHGPEAIEQSTESARNPCVVTHLTYARADLELKTFAHIHDNGKRTDVVLWTIQVHPEVKEFLTGLTIDIFALSQKFIGRSAAPARLIFAVPADQKVAHDSWEDTDFHLVEDESQPAPGDIAFISTPRGLVQCSPTGFRPCSGLSTEATVLKGGQSLRGAIIIPQNYQEAPAYDLDWAMQAYAYEREFWDKLPLLRLPFQVPDPAVMEMLEACARNILQAREIKEGLPEFQVGPTCYRGLWVVDGHFLLEAAQYLGYRDDAYKGVDALLKRVQPDGQIIAMKHHTKETGISLFTLVRQCELMGDDDRLRALWPIVLNAISYIEGMRKEAYALPVDSPCYGLLPESFGDGGVGGKRPEYTTTFWIIAGLKATYEAARRLGKAEDANRIQSDFDSLMADFKKHAERDSRVTPDGTPYLPTVMPGDSEHVAVPNYPGVVPQHLRLTPGSGTWAFCNAIYPGEVFSPDDPLVQNLLKLYEQTDDDEGMPAFTGWIPYQALWNYHVSFAAHAWLYAGQPDKAIDYLYAFANHASPTRVWREEQSLKASENGQLVGDMPHNWASAEFIRLVRHLLVFERKDTLELLAGLPTEWRMPGGVVNLERTPTRFGPVTLRLETLPDGQFTLDLALDPSWKHKPSALKVRLPASGVRLDGNKVEPVTGYWIELPIKEKMRLQGKWLA